MTNICNNKKVIEDGIEYDVNEWSSGDTYWRLSGEYHRVDNPAIEWANGMRSWWLNGECIYGEGIDNTAEFDLTEEMAKQIIKYRLKL